LTALILIPLLFWAIWSLPALYFLLLIAACIGVAAWEWAGLMGLKAQNYRILYAAIVLLGLYFIRSLPILPIFALDIVLWLWALVAVIQYERNQLPAGFQFSEVQAFFGFFILTVCWVALVNLRLGVPDRFGAIRLLLGLSIIFSADTAAYFSGRWLGRHALAPRVSPNKTWEGFVGGLVFAAVLGIGITFFFPMTFYQRLSFSLLAVFVSLFAVIGDLTVSLLKRLSGVKHSGQIFPGHGGMLDRIDSISAGIVIYSLGFLILFTHK